MATKQTKAEVLAGDIEAAWMNIRKEALDIQKEGRRQIIEYIEVRFIPEFQLMEGLDGETEVGAEVVRVAFHVPHRASARKGMPQRGPKLAEGHYPSLPAAIEAVTRVFSHLTKTDARVTQLHEGGAA